MTIQREAISLTIKQANNLYQNGLMNFNSNDKVTKALGFFQQSVGGKVLNEQYNKNVVVKDVAENQNGHLHFIDVKPTSKSRADMAMSKFADILAKDEAQSSNEFDI